MGGRWQVGGAVEGVQVGGRRGEVEGVQVGGGSRGRGWVADGGSSWGGWAACHSTGL